MFYFVTSSVDAPYGGVRVMYRFVDCLNEAGLPAAIVHGKSGFRCTSFDNSTRVISSDRIVLRPSDVVVVTEYRAYEHLARVAPGAAKIVVNQAAYLTFRDFPITSPLAPSPYADPDIIGVIVVSDDSLRLVSAVHPHLRVRRVHLSIDASLFSRDGAPERQIAFQTRKGRPHLAQVLYGLSHRGALQGWKLAPIENLGHADVASMLKRSAVYLSCPHESGESFGLLAAEAMASGALVIGFTGRGGSEFLLSDHAFPIADGDVLTFMLTAEGILQTFDTERSRYADMTARAREFVKDHYSPDRERNEVVDVFSGLSGGQERDPINRSLDLSGLQEPSRARSIAHHVKEAVRVASQRPRAG